MYTPTVKGVKVQARGIFLKIITELKKKKTLKYKTVSRMESGEIQWHQVYPPLYCCVIITIIYKNAKQELRRL